MNVFGIHSGYDGCCYVRLHLPFATNGWDQDKPHRREDKISISGVRQRLMEADVVVFHRAEEQEYHTLAKMLKKDGKKIVMDNDDTFILQDHHPLANFTPDGKKIDHLKRRQDNINSFVKLCDLVTVSTPKLRDEYLKYNDNVVVLPNCVEPLDWDEPLRNEGKKVRIGMVGSVACEYDYLHIKPLLKKLGEREDVTLVLFGLGDLKHRKENPLVTKVFSEEYEFWDSVNIEQFPWVHNYDYQDTLNETRLDIMLIPRKDNYFNRCKSNVKFLEASMLEIPVVAQSFDEGPYEEIEHGKTGFLIRDNNDWEPTIERLIKDKKLRRQVGKNAKAYTLKYYDINDNAYKWKRAYEQLCK
jgi:glycosyltransferase involved in cell wall biosynthesis